MNEVKTRTVTAVNKSAIKAFGLRVSTERKNGKFTRVSEEFVNEVEAELERIIRGIAGTEIADRPLVSEDDCPELITSKALDKLRPKLNLALARIIQRKVQGKPTCGKTL